MKFKTQWNSEEFPKKHEVNTQPSKTVPDQTMSVRTIMDRYAKGLPIAGGMRKPEYYGDTYMPDFKRMDISERQEAFKHIIQKGEEAKQ